jgi:calcineurin-like phosphoesterase family protein
MSETFFTSDTHFGHKKILTFETPRPFKTIEEHDEALITNWNSVVTNEDTVYHLGDFALEDGKERLKETIARLNFARLIIIFGNHDNSVKFPIMFPEIKYFGAFELRKHNMILTHIPVHPSQMSSGRFTMNLHGHLHHDVVHWIDDGQDTYAKDDRYYNVGVDHHNYTPVNLEEILKDV